MKRFTPLIVKTKTSHKWMSVLSNLQLLSRPKLWQILKGKLLHRLLTRIVKNKLLRTSLSRQLMFKKHLEVSRCRRIGMQRPLTKSRTKPIKLLLSEIKIWTAT